LTFILLIVESLGGWNEETVEINWSAFGTPSRAEPSDIIPTIPTSLHLSVERECHHEGLKSHYIK
jgi:hypothetical protein